MLYVSLVLAGVVATIAAVWIPTLIGGPGQMVFGKGEYAPDDLLKVGFFATLLIGGLAVGLNFVIQARIQEEYDALKEATEVEQVAPTPPRPTSSTQTEQQWRIAENERRGLRFVSRLEFERDEDEEGPDTRAAALYVGEEFQQSNNLWFRRAALEYEGGASIDLKIAVLYGDESWQRGSEEHVAQRRRGRPVHVEKAIDTPFMRRALAQSDYAVCLGLASSEMSGLAQLNEELSDHRAVNLCRAVANLRLKETEYVRGVGLGYARSSTELEDMATRQRAIVVVGVDVIGNLYVSDLVRSVAQLITLNGVKFADYSRGVETYSVFKEVTLGAYTGARNVRTVDGNDDSFLVLKEPEN